MVCVYSYVNKLDGILIFMLISWTAYSYVAECVEYDIIYGIHGIGYDTYGIQSMKYTVQVV